MATQSVQQDKFGPDWPLGMITVTAAGTPVSIMSLVDPSGINDPGVPTSGSNDAYTRNAQQIAFQAVKPGTSHGTQPNTGNIYIMRKGIQGVGNRDDYGSMVEVLTPGQTLFIASAAMNRNVYSPYRYYIDADNNGDSAIVTLFIG